jgi:hypothetical protein
MLQDYCHNAIASMLSALTIVLFATALWFLGPLLNYHVGQLPLGLSNWKAAIVKAVL